MSKTRVGVICGGPSAEHEVSLQSAHNIVNAIDRERFEITVIGVDRSGRWHALDPDAFLINADDPRRIALKTGASELAIVPGRTCHRLIDLAAHAALAALDVVFPIIHGSFGEDGTLQGVLRALDLACVGSGVSGSAVAMDKDISKRLLRDAGLTVAPFHCFDRASAARADYAALAAELGPTLFVKPANQGSSVGVSRVHDAPGFSAALERGFAFDHKVLVETAVRGREIECAVLGNDAPEASLCGEIVVRGNGFYSYDTKYVEEDSAAVIAPADIGSDPMAAIQRTALRAFAALGCAGLARVDVFLCAGDRVIVNEVNTLPGFTRISMYPKLWQASGLSYPALVTRLIELALERHTADQALQRNV